jgi:hypothetical protein
MIPLGVINQQTLGGVDSGLHTLRDGMQVFYGLADVTDAHGGTSLVNYGSTPFVAGHVGDAAEYNGTNHRLLWSGSGLTTTWCSAGERDISMNTWYIPDSVTGYRIIASRLNGQAQSNYEWVLAANGADIDFYVMQAGTTPIILKVVGALTISQPCHIYAEHDWDGTGELGLRIDNGTKQTVTGPTSVTTLNAYFCLGASAWPIYLSSGLIDQYQFHDRLLTVNEQDAAWNDGDGINYIDTGIVYFYDTFSDEIDGTAITAHDPEIDLEGGGWVSGQGAPTIVSDKAKIAGTNDRVGADIGSVTDYAVSSITNEVSWYRLLFARGTSTGGGWRMEGGLGTYVRLYEESTVRQTSTITTAGDQDWKIVVSGASIKCYVDGVLAIDYTATGTQVYGTYCGIQGAGNATFDDFKVTGL